MSQRRCLSLRVLGLSHWLQMVGVHASRVPAQVIENKSSWNLALGDFKRSPMREHQATRNSHPSIAESTDVSLPVPAFRRVINDVVLWEFRVPSRRWDMPVEKSGWFALYPALFARTLTGYRGRQPTPTLTDARRVWFGPLVRLFLSLTHALGGTGFDPAFRGHDEKHSSALRAGFLDGNTLWVYFTDLLTGLWGAMARGVDALPGFSLPQFYPERASS